MIPNFPLFLQTTAKEHLRRFNSRMKSSGRVLDMAVQVRQDEVNTFLTLRSARQGFLNGETGTLIIPRPRKNEFGNWIIGDRNDRALCPLMIVLNGQPQHVTYEEMVGTLLSSNVEELFPEQGKRNYFDKIMWSFSKGQGRVAVGMCQRFLNQSIFNSLPLSGTSMQDWAMNHRLMIFDPIFETLRPEEKLAYQKRKNELLFPWSSIGLSDGAAAVKNYILQADLRKYTAFGNRHHNPIRNLYSTLGMKGEEKPLIISKSMSGLEEQGISRGGWNWMTVFLDLPLNFEDQILVSRRHAGKKVTDYRSFIVFGEESVVLGDSILKDRILGMNEDETPVVFDIDCDHAKVVEVKNGVVPFDGNDQPVRIVTLEVVYSFKEGFKITNQHGNKGIVILEDLGMVHDPKRGEVPIDVIVSARSVQKRKNFGQILEALATLIHGPERRFIVPDDTEVSQEQVEKSLVSAGYSKEGSSKISTSWGEFDTLCGWIHWGVTKAPEEQLWEKKDTWAENQRGLRTRGNKLSTVELKALTTLFGAGSKVVGEILSYQQGLGEVQELLQILDSLRGNVQEELPVVSPESFVYIPTGMGTFHSMEGLAGTLADEHMYPQGCYLQLPITLRMEVPLERWKNPIREIIVGEENAYGNEGCKVYEIDRLLIPSFSLRQPWRHPTGKFGLSEVTTVLNQILENIDLLQRGEIKPAQLSALIYKYLHNIGRSLSTKSGKISSYLMSVRYPHSSKATAVLGRNLEANWVEIHKDMARDLNVQTGDYILVERFPCLGFMSVRIQRVRVTDDVECKYVIRVSGNSLVSMNLDFDGDVIYVMSFHTEAAKEELQANFHNPHPRIKEVLETMNGKKVPITRSMNLQEMSLKSFAPLTPEEHANLNETSLAVKLYTGPVIALCYNLMRIVEGSFSYQDRETHINIEVFLDKVGNSVFSQKHGIRSLREECTEAVCLADSQGMVRLGFPEKESEKLCQAIRISAAKLGVRNNTELKAHYERHIKEGRSSIINAIVRRFHKSYFATRSNLHPLDLLEHLDSKPNDLASFLIQESLRKVRTAPAVAVA